MCADVPITTQLFGWICPAPIDPNTSPRRCGGNNEVCPPPDAEGAIIQAPAEDKHAGAAAE